MTRFSNSFWNSELCNFSGFDVLCKRMKDGKQMTKDYADFLKLRAQIQENYGKSLMKLAKTAGGKEEVGTLKHAWDSLKQQTENIGNAHIIAANSVIEELNGVLEFMEMQREERRKFEDKIRKIQTNIKVLYRKTMEYKKICEIRCREAEQATQMLSSCDGNRSNVPPKDIEKLRQKKVKAYTTAEQADVNYRSAVDSLEHCRVQWEQETEKTCDQFQLLEEDRIRRLRNSMWVATNIGSTVCVREDELQEEVRKVLERCDIEADILCFIRQRQTGSERPACIESENYFGGQFEKNGNSTGITMPGVTMKPGAGGMYLPRSPVSNPTDSPITSDQSLNSTDTENNEALTDELYDSVCLEDVDVSNDNKPIKCRVLYDFEGRNDEELTLQESEMVTLIQKETSDWWEVQAADGKKGYYPAAYLEVLR